MTPIICWRRRVFLSPAEISELAGLDDVRARLSRSLLLNERVRGNGAGWQSGLWIGQGQAGRRWATESKYTKLSKTSLQD